MKNIDNDQLERFVLESNKIEGIDGVREIELAASRNFLNLSRVHISDLEEFVHICANGAKLRSQLGMDVRVGTHYPPRGGPDIKDELEHLLKRVHNRSVGPHETHCLYECLHPFQDGNGRSGRILWAWQMLRHNESHDGAFGAYDFGLSLGFLHAFYYQTLEARQKK